MYFCLTEGLNWQFLLKYLLIINFCFGGKSSHQEAVKLTVFLTSHTGGWTLRGGVREPAALIADNRLIENLGKRWTPGARVLYIAADPDSCEKNDAICAALRISLPISGLPTESVTVCDSRSEELAGRLDEYDCVILAGGHVPTQNRFFQRIGLRKALSGYNGIVVGISAGSMNSAETVYAHPECPGEAESYLYQRFLPGLGLTRVMILPHYQYLRYDVLDGLRVIEDIACPDSADRSFFCLPDGSYIIVENGETVLYGEAWKIRDGEITKINENNSSIVLTQEDM